MLKPSNQPRRSAMTRGPLPITPSLILSLLSTLLFASFVLAYSGGPPNGRTGAPGEGNCTGCHGSFTLDSGLGGYTLSTGQVDYAPGDNYTVVIELSDPYAERWGFELTFIDDTGAAAGTLLPLDANTQVGSSGGRDYGKHTSVGTNWGQVGSNSWMMSWTAPAVGTGTVSLYAMGNAANGDGTAGGDFIYSFTTNLDEGIASSVDPFAGLAFLDPNYPNPFNPKTSIPFSLERDGYVRLSIYNARGGLVTVLEDGPMEAGSHESRWAGTDSRGRSQASGVYLARLTSRGGEDLAPARKMVLSK